MNSIEQYLHGTLDVKVKIRSWIGEKELPFFLTNLYEFGLISLLGQSCILMISKDNADTTPALIKKHWEQLQRIWPGFCIYVQKFITAYNRKRLIEHRIPFIVPGNQLYLPDLGIDLREHLRGIRSHPKALLSPATQAIIIHALLHNPQERQTASNLAKALGYSSMTLSRAFDELGAAGIGEVSRIGKERGWQFKAKKRQLWEQAKVKMRSPVKIALPSNCIPDVSFPAGLSALSYYSDLTPPSTPVCAISLNAWKIWKQSLIAAEEATNIVEIWHYDPSLFAQKIVDPFSLYLSLEKSEDERVEAALEKMLEEFTW